MPTVDADPAAIARAAAIINPATRGSVAAMSRLLRAAAPPATALEIFVTTAPGSGRSLAGSVRDWADLVIAVGGDGTVADVASGLFGRHVPLAIVPSGSTNIIAKELGIPLASRRAASLAFRSRARAKRDVGRCGDRCFLHMAGAGLDSRFFRLTDRRLKRRFGWLAYLPAALAALQFPPARFTIRADDRALELRSSLVVIANGAAIITPSLRLHPRIVSDDGWLDLLVFTAVDPSSVAATLGLLATGRLADSPYLITQRAKRVEMVAEPPLPVQLDGDVVAETPALFEVVPGGIEVVVPEEAEERGRARPRRGEVRG